MSQVGGTAAVGKRQGDDNDRRVRFGRLLAEALKAHGWRQDDLARALGTTQSSVSGWINGKYEPAAGTVFSIERALDMAPGGLSRPLGYLPVGPVAPTITVEGVISGSPLLDEDEKAALLATYHVLVTRGGRRGGAGRAGTSGGVTRNRARSAPAATPARPRFVPRSR